MSERDLKELRERLEFAAKIEIEPYDEVREFLDELAISTAKESVEGMVKLLEPLGVKV